MNKLKIQQENKKYLKRLNQEMIVLEDTFSAHILEFLMYMDSKTVNWLEHRKKTQHKNELDYLEFYFKKEELDFVNSLRD